MIGMLAGVVGAQTDDVVAGTNKVLNDIIGVLEPVTKWIIGDTGGESDLLFAKLLLLIIIVAVIWYPLSSFPGLGGNGALVFVISLAVGLLGVRFLKKDIIAAVTLPYSAFAVALTALIPLVLYFVWIERGLQGSPTLRKVAWIFAAVIFVGLFIARYEEIKALTPLNALVPVWYYLIAAGLCIIFLFADKTIQRTWVKAQREEANELLRISRQGEFVEEYDKIIERFSSNHLTKDEANTLIKNIKKKAVAYRVNKKIFKEI